MTPKYKKTPEVVRQILQTLEGGATRTAAAAKAGVSIDTLRRWKDEDEEFAALLTRAEGVAEASMAEALFVAGASDWRAAESWLKRRRIHEWGDNVSLRADKEAQRLIAEMFGEGSAGDIGEAEAGASQTADVEAVAGAEHPETKP